MRGMRAWVVHKPGPVATGPLRLTERPVPEPGPGELRLKVTVNPYPFDRADQAVADLAAERFTGAAVISM
jgi:alcohol dehydrogenase, propanol-preferring